MYHMSVSKFMQMAKDTKVAQELTEKRRFDSLSGIRTKGEEFKQLDSLITELVKRN